MCCGIKFERSAQYLPGAGFIGWINYLYFLNVFSLPAEVSDCPNSTTNLNFLVLLHLGFALGRKCRRKLEFYHINFAQVILITSALTWVVSHLYGSLLGLQQWLHVHTCCQPRQLSLFKIIDYYNSWQYRPYVHTWLLNNKVRHRLWNGL